MHPRIHFSYRLLSYSFQYIIPTKSRKIFGREVTTRKGEFKGKLFLNFEFGGFEATKRLPIVLKEVNIMEKKIDDVYED